MPQLSTSGRVVTAVATSAGNILYCRAGDSAWTAPTNNSGTTPALDATVLNFATALDGKLWFTDGFNYRYFDPATATVDDWVASAGTLPHDDDSLIPRIIETWRGRVVLLGLVGDPYNWFMSRIGDPTDYDYAPVSPGPADAVAGSAAPQGKVGDMVTGFIPFTDDIAYLGCSHSLYMFRGDPQANGQIDLVSDTIGMAWGRAWCKDPYGTIYFFSNRCGIYTVAPGQQPQRISMPIDNLLVDINSGENTVTLMWDDRQQGVHVWITPTEAAGDAIHYFFEQRTGGWFQDTYSNANHDPLCACQFDGNNPEDRVVLMGSFDGVVRFLDPNASTDDGRIIQSTVVIGPVMTETLLDTVMIKELQIVLGADSGRVEYGVLAGRTAEAALNSTPRVTGRVLGGRNQTESIRVSDHVIYLSISGITQWRMEQGRVLVATKGKIRRRSTY